MGGGRVSPSSFFHQLQSPSAADMGPFFQGYGTCAPFGVENCTVSLLREHVSWVAYDRRCAVHEACWRKVRQVGSVADTTDLQMQMNEPWRAGLAHKANHLARLHAHADGVAEEAWPRRVEVCEEDDVVA